MNYPTRSCVCKGTVVKRFATRMNTDDYTPDYTARLRKAFRYPETETDLGKAVARLRHPFQVGDGEKWLYEGFISFFTALFDALRAIDDSIPPGLPPHLLDPAWIAEAFHIPLKDFNWQTESSSVGRSVDKSGGGKFTLLNGDNHGRLVWTCSVELFSSQGPRQVHSMDRVGWKPSSD